MRGGGVDGLSGPSGSDRLQLQVEQPLLGQGPVVLGQGVAPLRGEVGGQVASVRGGYRVVPSLDDAPMCHPHQVGAGELEAGGFGPALEGAVAAVVDQLVRAGGQLVEGVEVQ